MKSGKSLETQRLADDLHRIGVERGDLIILHSSFKALKLKFLTPKDVLRVFLKVLGNEGTLMAPTYTYSYSGIWKVRPFDPLKTPGLLNGILTETLRHFPGALRSGHPTYSVAAVGRLAGLLTRDRENASALGRGSSFGDALQHGAKILLLGVGNNRNSALHHAEVLAGLPYNDIPFRAFWGTTALVRRNGKACEVPLANEFPACSFNFGAADQYLKQKGVLTPGQIGAANCFLMNGLKTVEAVAQRLRRKPDWLLCNNIICEPCTLRKRRLLEKGLI
jgi:aminoglycoside 3-N-acetyltransferase